MTPPCRWASSTSRTPKGRHPHLGMLLMVMPASKAMRAKPAMMAMAILSRFTDVVLFNLSQSRRQSRQPVAIRKENPSGFRFAADRIKSGTKSAFRHFHCRMNCSAPGRTNPAFYALMRWMQGAPRKSPLHPAPLLPKSAASVDGDRVSPLLGFSGPNKP